MSLYHPDHAPDRSRLSWLLGGAAAGVIAAVVLAPSFGPALTRAADTTDVTEHNITVQGTGTIKVKPDVADVSLGVTVRRDHAKESSAAAADQMTKIIAALKAAGIADADIQTAMLSLQPVYDYTNNTQRVIGYETSNQVSVTVRDLAAVGDVIDGAVEAGATNVSGIAFRLDDQSKVEAQARQQAVKDARAKADALASAAGVNITGVISLSEVSAPTPMPIYMERAALAADKSGTPVQPGNVELSVTVQVVYSIP